MVDNFFKVKHGITFADGYGPAATEEGSVTYSSALGRLELRDGYGNIKSLAFSDDVLQPPTSADFATPRITLNVTAPTSSPVDNAGLVIKFGESAGDELFGSTLFSGEFNPCVLWDQDTLSWFIGTASSEGLRVGSDAYGVTLTANNNPRITVSSDLYLTPGSNLIIPEDAVDGYLLVADANGFATWQPPGAAAAIPLQTAYSAGNSITISSGVPVTVTGPAAQPLLYVAGDARITGSVTDTKGIEFLSQSLTPFGASEQGLWVNTSNELIFKRPSPLPEVNLVALSEAFATVNVQLNNNTGGALAKGTPVRINTNGELDTINVSNSAQSMRTVGVTGETIFTGTSGLVVTSGKVFNLTTTATFGDIMYVDKTGALTNSLPTVGVAGFVAGDFLIKVGVITKNVDNPAQKDLLVNIQVVARL